MTTASVDSPSMGTLDFGSLIHAARAEKKLSLRQLASLSGVDYSRLARIEQGTRPAPDLAAIRSLADVLDLDLAELVVAAGTSRSVMEDLVWSERARLGRAVPELGAYRPGFPRLLERNTVDGHVVGRRGALCAVRVGDAIVHALSFSLAPVLRLVVPPESIVVSTACPAHEAGSTTTVLKARVTKARRVGQLENLVLTADGLTLNALRVVHRSGRPAVPGDSVYITLLTAAIHTTPLEEEG